MGCAPPEPSENQFGSRTEEEGVLLPPVVDDSKTAGPETPGETGLHLASTRTAAWVTRRTAHPKSGLTFSLGRSGPSKVVSEVPEVRLSTHTSKPLPWR